MKNILFLLLMAGGTIQAIGPKKGLRTRQVAKKTTIAPPKPLPKKKLEKSTDNHSNLRKFLASYFGICVLGTYAWLYLNAKTSSSPIDHKKFMIDAVGYSGTAFSIGAASYCTALLLTDSQILQKLI